MKNQTQIILDIIGGIALTALTFLFGVFDLPLQILVFFVIVDYVTGLTAAWIKGQLCSDVGIKGIAKKVGFFALVAVIYQADKLFFTEGPLRILTIWALVINELISIVENLHQIGVPIPSIVTQKLEKLKEQG